ncbi:MULTISPECIES: hypothetical protein [Staphylococcus]|uniref:Uncharacterized protein n=1 Tax=Staphylococcus chromogenes TaxID=46126 RepID=A0ABD5AYL2_STACR|nr:MULTISPECIES: hypothetical protein [Staphylococcus]KDP12995.1 hypothetical protein SCHR_05037 [Staphylococcus chromogenes MU 970]MBV5138001.1 hypothetical protein [Staphylococcus chromogenes]MBV5190622.1 hypothetical protein [Staphylococcus chromogenes]MBW3132087.1 hypothetical protein [Staphylococcus chromogenes]MBW6087960.1 hypothetical protein [Staphylococcus chromogenes]
MSTENNAQQSNEQLKAQKLFAQWRKDETLYKEDEKNSENQTKKDH